jgi:hypothetical protein
MYEWVGGWVLRWMRVRAGVVGREMGEGNDVIVACLGLGWNRLCGASRWLVAMPCEGMDGDKGKGPIVRAYRLAYVLLGIV